MNSIHRTNTIFELVIFGIICCLVQGEDNQTNSTPTTTSNNDLSTQTNGSLTSSNDTTLSPVNNQTTDILHELRRERRTTILYPTITRKKRITMKKTQSVKKISTIPTTTPYRPPISYSFANTIFIPEIERNETLKKAKEYFNFRYGIPAAFHDFYIWYYGVQQDKEARERRMAVTEPSYTPGYYTRMHVMHHTVFHVPTDFWDYYIAVNDLAGRTTDPTPITLPDHFTFAPTPYPTTERRTYETCDADNYLDDIDASVREIQDLVGFLAENEACAENATIVAKLLKKLMAREIL